jgi:Carboxypeptidase regulatory-like domain
MSGLITSRGAGNADPSPVIGVTIINDEILQPPDYRFTLPGSIEGKLSEVDIDWPRSSFPQQATAVGGGFTGLDGMHQNWEMDFAPLGAHVRKVVRGVVYDAANNPVSGATVRLFNTSTGVLVDTQTTAADGSFTCGDPNAVNCFAVAYLAGSPDTTGLTVNNLTGT